MKYLILISLLFLSVTPQAQVVKLDASKFKFINHSSIGRPNALIEHGQDTLLTPNCGSWTTQPYDSVYCYNLYNNYQVVATPSRMPYPISFTIDLGVYVVLSRGAVFVANDAIGAISGHCTIKTGTPYLWATTLKTITDDGTARNQWHKFNGTSDTVRFIHFAFDKDFSALAETVFYGTIIDTVAVPTYSSIPMDVYKPFGVNTLFGMGHEKLKPGGRNYVLSSKRNRIFEYAYDKFADTITEPLINGGTGLNGNSSELLDTIAAHGVNSWIAFVTMTTLKQWRPTVPVTGALSFQKPIDWQDGMAGDTTTDATLHGIPYFNNVGINGKIVAQDPYYYRRAAYNAMRLATAYGSRTLSPMDYIEIGNEQTGNFQYSGCLGNADEYAAMSSALLDGHCNTLTFNGDSIGVRNSGTGILMVMSPPDVYRLSFLEAVAFWAKYNRADSAFPADIINVHSYPTLAEGGIKRAFFPESDSFQLREKMLEYADFAYRMGKEHWMTEGGYDSNAYDSTTPCAPSTSFMNVPNVPGLTVDQAQGNAVARFMLVMRSTNTPMAYFWLADQFNNKSRCGTFGTSGLLNQDSMPSFSPWYTPRPAWYYYRTIDSLIIGKRFVSDTLIISGSDSIRIQKYHSVTNTDSVLYAIWSPTAKNAVIYNYSFPIGTGFTVATVNVTEKPLFILAYKDDKHYTQIELIKGLENGSATMKHSNRIVSKTKYVEVP